MRFIRINENSEVISVRYGKESTEDEIPSDLGELGQIMQLDGTFITPEPEPVVPQETLEEKIDRLEQQVEQNNLIQFEVLATIFEELMMLGSE